MQTVSLCVCKYQQMVREIPSEVYSSTMKTTSRPLNEAGVFRGTIDIVWHVYSAWSKSIVFSTLIHTEKYVVTQIEL